jgi:hypothetical protein
MCKDGSIPPQQIDKIIIIAVKHLIEGEIPIRLHSRIVNYLKQVTELLTQVALPERVKTRKFSF